MKTIEYHGYGVDIRNVIDRIYTIKPNFSKNIIESLESRLENVDFPQPFEITLDSNLTVSIDIIYPQNTDKFETLLLIYAHDPVVNDESPNTTITLLTITQANTALTKAIIQLTKQPLTDEEKDIIQQAVTLESGTNYENDWSDLV